jgi:purine-binding chemotaxis protein CheW
MASNKQFVTFWIGDTFFGIDIMQVKEVNSEFQITPLFHGSDVISGYVNLRGEIYLILDLKIPLRLDPDPHSQGKLIIFKRRIAEPFGIIVDRIGDVVEVEGSDIHEFNNSQGEGSNKLNVLYEQQIIDGISRLPDNLMISLDAGKILELIKNT